MASFIFISCEKSTGALGLDLVVDGKAVLGIKRTIPLIITSEATDSIQTTEPQNVIVGYLDDMVFGTSQNSFVSQYILSQTNPNFGDDAICDSAKLVMLYTGYYGDTNTLIEINVHELEQELKADTSYYSNEKFLTGSLLGFSQFRPRPNTAPAFEDTLIIPSAIINIDPAWVNNKIILPAIADDPAFDSNDDFVKYFKGIQVSASRMGNCTPFLDVNSAASFLRIYYRKEPTDTVAQKFDLYAEVGLASANLSEFDYTNAEFDLDNQDTVNGEELLYVQSMGGTSSRINLEALKTYKDSAFIINKAELVFHVSSGTDVVNQPPKSLYLLEEKQLRIHKPHQANNPKSELPSSDQSNYPLFLLFFQ